MTKKIAYPPPKPSEPGSGGSVLMRLVSAALPLALVIAAYYLSQAVLGG